jgi:acetylornithine/LysW-gamma-L-lysine aminotransferase
VAGHGAALIGHGNSWLAEAIYKQALKLISCPGIFYNTTRALFLEKLMAIAPSSLRRAFLCNSGTEAVEAAIKFARFATKKKKFICAYRSFHGRTLGALSATFNPKYRKDFEPLVPGFHFVPFNNFNKLIEAVDEDTAGIILEPIQGEGGVHVAEKEYLQKVQQLCKEKEILLIIDEVQTGFGRTGKMFAIEHFEIEPDIMCLAKAIAGGIPMGVLLLSSSIPAPRGKHGSTFGGNPLACAAALATIDFIVNNNLPYLAAEKGAYIINKLRKINSEKIREIRGLGLMIGIELKEKASPYIKKLMKEGVLALTAGPSVLRLLPPLVIEYEQIDYVVEKLEKVLKS